MAENLQKTIDALKEFIDPTNSRNLREDAYKGLLFEGLQESNFYKTNILNSTEKRLYNGRLYFLPEYFTRMSTEITGI